MIGDQIGPFQIEAEIGRGGMGVVYRARDERLDRIVAIKAIAPQLSADRDRMEVFRREARTIAQLNHPHIAQIHQIYEHEQHSYLVLEYVPGQSLAERLRGGGALEVTDALRLCAQVARAMEAAHARGIVHRDLKPDNIRVTEDGVAKVLDFGIALAAPKPIAPDAATVRGAPDGLAEAQGSIAGTPGYMPPEQCRGERVDARADIFSFGCVMYECLTGARAISGDTDADIIAATLTEDPDFSRLPPQLPDGVASLVRRCLSRDLDERLHDIADARLLIEEALGARRPTPARSTAAAVIPNNLPDERDHFIGRVSELAELTSLLEDARLLTLTGSGGCGKTRLARELARRVMDRFPGGVWLAELAPADDPTRIASVVAEAVGVREQPNTPVQESIRDRLTESKTLLILDNCEHVLEATSDLSGALLDDCKELLIVATSREALGVRGEHACRVPSLELPPSSGGGGTRTPAPGITPRLTPHTPAPTGAEHVSSLMACESVALFVDRAREVRPNFELTEANATAIASICRRLDGIPLAIELAAARAKMLSPDQIEQRLDDRFKLLRAGRGKAERHQTLRATVDWSYRMLTDEEKHALRQLSVFPERCTLDAARFVIGGRDADEFDVLDLLTHLTDKSLLLVNEEDDEARYRLLETVRQYAEEELDRAEEMVSARDRHLAFFHEMLQQADEAMAFESDSIWSRRVHAELQNLLHAMMWGVTRGAGEGSEPSPINQALRIGGRAGWYWSYSGQYVAMRAVLEAVIKAGSHASADARGNALRAAADLAMRQGDLRQARVHADEALVIHRELGDEGPIARCLNTLGVIAHLEDDYEGARDLLEQGLAINRRVEDWRGVLANLGNLGLVARDQGSFDEARTFQEECIRIGQERGYDRSLAVARLNIAPVLRDLGDHAGASAALCEAIARGSALGMDHHIAESLDETAVLAAQLGEHERAARLLGAAEALYEETGGGRYIYVKRAVEANLPAAQAALRDATGSDAAWDQAVFDGGQLGIQRAVEEALSWLRTKSGTGPAEETGT